jgi:hypothetical protein
MSRLVRRWWLLVAAMVTALAVVVAGTVPAFAAEPGESSSWSQESVGGNQLQSYDTYSEARGGQTGALVQVWRGLDNHVWLAVGNGPVFAVGGGGNTTTTYVAPRVIYSNGWFYIFQTGTDNHIYWSRAFDGTVGGGFPSVGRGADWSSWTAIAGNPATQQSVSVASAPGSGLLMTWLGVDQNNMYSAWLPSGSDVFDATQGMPFTSNSAPVVTFDPATSNFFLVWRGLSDNRIYMSTQMLGEDFWDGAQALTGLTTPTSPTIAADGNGDLLVSAVDFDGNVWLQAINNADQTRGWSQESAHIQTGVPVWISVIASIFYIIATSGDNVEWKQGWNAGSGI